MSIDLNKDTQTSERKHSGLAISSFALSLVAGALTFVFVVIAGVVEAASGPGGMDENSPQAVFIGLCIFGCLFLDMVAIGLGVGALMQKGGKKVLAVLGTVFSAVTIFGIILLILIGSFM